METNTYHDSLAVIAAGNVLLSAKTKAAEADPIVKQQRKILAQKQRDAINGRLARACFPNNLCGARSRTGRRWRR